MNIFFFGDSICFGQGISIHKGWVTRISRDIDKLALEYKIPLTVVNSAVNGNTTRLALERMPYDIQSRGLDLIIIQFGMNDCNYWKTDHGLSRVSPLAFEANLREIICRAKVFGAQKVFLNTNHLTSRTHKHMPFTNITYEENNKKYNNIIRQVAKSTKDVILNDIERYLSGYFQRHKLNFEETLMEDGLHLNLLGHNLYYKFISPRIMRAVKEILCKRKE